MWGKGHDHEKGPCLWRTKRYFSTERNARRQSDGNGYRIFVRSLAAKGEQQRDRHECRLVHNIFSQVSRQPASQYLPYEWPRYIVSWIAQYITAVIDISISVWFMYICSEKSTFATRLCSQGNSRAGPDTASLPHRSSVYRTFTGKK